MKVSRWLNSQHHFGLITKLLHGTVALLMIGLIGLGWYMVDLSYYDRWYNDSLSLHKAFGMVLLLTALFKIAWTLLNTRPEFSSVMASWEKFLAHSTHGLLLLLLVLIPISGYIISTSAGDSISVFNWFDIPALFSVTEEWRDIAIELHYFLAYGALLIIVFHVVAALKHQFINRDGTIRKMFW
ncbi:MAG: cytochrome b [Pseudomonadales bacterium]|nr:cytochrome b [Pseudomonadales bacterium]